MFDRLISGLVSVALAFLAWHGLRSAGRRRGGDVDDTALAEATATVKAWLRGKSWITPVRLPAGFDINRIEVEDTGLAPADWAALGLTAVEGWRAEDAGLLARLALPAISDDEIAQVHAYLKSLGE